MEKMEKRKIKVLNMSYNSTEELKRIVEELSKVELDFLRYLREHVI